MALELPTGTPRRVALRDRDEAVTADVTTRMGTEEELFRRYFATRDPAIREELVARYIRFARSMASRYAGKGELSEDLFQVACVGLVNAIDRFDPTRGKPFVAFAAPTVLGELRRHLRDKVWALRLPRRLQERTRQVEAAIGELSLELGRAPTIRETADALDLAEDEVLEAFDAASQRRVNSLDAPVAGDDAGAETLVERLGARDGGFARAEDWTTVESLLPLLTEEELKVLRMRFVDELTQSEIGERIGRSQMHVSRMLRRTLERLREALG